MIVIEVKKFGNILNSRPSAREAVLRVKQMVNGSGEDITLDFSGVDLLTPSFADEFVRGIRERYQEKAIDIRGIENDVVRDTLIAIGAFQQ